MKSVKLCSIICVFLGLSALFSCKKAGPTIPYDLRIPPLNADLVLAAVDKSTPVSLLGLELYSPKGIKYTGYTDLFGRIGFNFDDMEKGTWTAKVPAQGRYYDSEIVFDAANGNIGVTFTSDPSLILEPATNTTYAYTTQTDIVLNVHYNQGGALNVPITLTNASLPAGWTYNFTPILGRDTHNGVVSITIPTGQYQQPVFDLFGIVSGPSTYVRTDLIPPVSSVTIKRNFQIQAHLEVSWNASYSIVPSPNGTWTFTGTYCLYVTNGSNIPWTGTLNIGNGTNDTRWGSWPLTGTGSTLCGNWSSSCAGNDGHRTLGLKFMVGISAPYVGSYSYNLDSGICPICPHANPYTLPTNTY